MDTVGREEREATADAAWLASRNVRLVIERIESCYRDEGVARTLGDRIEEDLVQLKDMLSVLDNAAQRLDRCVATRH